MKDKIFFYFCHIKSIRILTLYDEGYPSTKKFLINSKEKVYQVALNIYRAIEKEIENIMELKSTLMEKVAGNADLEKISIAFEKRHGFRADKVLNKLYDTQDGNELLIRCFYETGANKGIITVLKRGILTNMVKEQIMFYVDEGEYGIQCHLLTDYENKDYNLLIDKIVIESFIDIKKA